MSTDKKKLDIVEWLRAEAVLLAGMDRMVEAADAIDLLRTKVSNLILAVDWHFGTPCEQIRHLQKVEELEQKIKDLEAKIGSAPHDNGGTEKEKEMKLERPSILFESFLSRHPISDEFRRALAVGTAALLQAFRDRHKD